MNKIEEQNTSDTIVSSTSTLNESKTKNRLIDNSKPLTNKKSAQSNRRRFRGLPISSIKHLTTNHYQDINEQFLDACENGDYPTVTRILDTLKDFNIDVTDHLGRSALRLAVENEHLEVVQVLLGKSDSQKLRESLLLAIYLGHTQIAESILKHPKYKVLNEKKFVNGNTDSFWQTPGSDDAQFSPDITPLILAAQYDRVQIVQVLLISGDRIIKPHDYYCNCNECSNKFKFDSLRHAQSRLNAYNGLASESYISLASVDPILTAFELGHELRILAENEKYFKIEYTELAQKLSQYAVKLLNNVRGKEELDIVLNKTGKETEEKYEQLARLDLALKYEEKPFVAHSNCQQKLVEIWYTGIRRVTKMNAVLAAATALSFTCVMPFIYVVYIFAPNLKMCRFVTQPCIKFLAHTISYLIFILMIIVSSIQFAQVERDKTRFSACVEYANYVDIYANYTYNLRLKHRFPAHDFYMRSSFLSNLDLAISIWILGFMWHEIKQIYSDGFKNYFLQWNNTVDSCMIILYVASFALKYYSMIMVQLNENLLEDPVFWQQVKNLNETDHVTQVRVYEVFYWLNDDRFYWTTLDPIHLAEGLFALANIFSFSRICFLLPANQDLGPLQISLGKMISDIVRFVIIFSIIFVAFIISLNNLFWYYQSNTRNHVEIIRHLNDDNSTTKAEKSFGTIVLTFWSVFWAIFGLGDPKNVMLEPFENDLTLYFGYFLYGTWHISSVIVLLNMLIAMMAKSYEDILLNSDIEWKFARSKLYMEFIKGGSSLPVPLNVIPTPKSAYYLMIKIKNLLCSWEKKSFKRQKLERKHKLPNHLPLKPKNLNETGRMNVSTIESLKNLPDNFTNLHNDLQRRTSLTQELTYAKVMQRIVKRFLLYQQRESEDAHEGDFEELKQDLQMVRYEISDELKKTCDDTLKCLSLVNNGIGLIGDELLKNCTNEEKKSKFNALKLLTKSSSDSVENEAEETTTVDNSPIESSTKTLNSNESSLIHTTSVPDLSNGLETKSTYNQNLQNKRLSLIKSKIKHLSRSKTMSLIELNVINEEDEHSNDGHKRNYHSSLNERL